MPGSGQRELHEAVELATLEWVDWFINRRLPEPICNIPPIEAEKRYYAMLDKQKLAARLKRNGLLGTRRRFILAIAWLRGPA